jgi:hypothetical protein
MDHTQLTDFFEDLWRANIGTDFIPPRKTFSRWAGSFSQEIFLQALEITARKIKSSARFGATFTDEQIARYVSGTGGHLRQDAFEAEAARGQ